MVAPAGAPPVDVPGISGAALAGLAEIPRQVLDGREGRPSATLAGITAALRDGAPMLFLACHGALVDGEPYLWLEQAGAGPYRPVAGAVLVEAIAQLDRRPLLIVLAACQGAGTSYEMLRAVGPQLARAGVGAVLAMREQVPQATVAALLPPLFAELRRDGEVDRALAAARAALGEALPWWLPVLWLRARDGRLWREETAPAASDLPGGIHIGGNVGTVQVVKVSGSSGRDIIGIQVSYGALPLSSRRSASRTRWPSVGDVLLGPPDAPERWAMALLAAQLGFEEAQCTLGSAYARYDEGAQLPWPLSAEDSRHWYTLAAVQGNPDAQYTLEMRWLRGEGGPADPTTGVHWLTQAAKQGCGVNHDTATETLAELYATGRLGVASDARSAAYWRERAATLASALAPRPLAEAPTAAPPAAKEVAASPVSRPTAAPLASAAPAATRGPDGGDRDELDANLNLHTWIQAVETGNSDLGSYLYRLEAGAKPGEVLAHIKALRYFIAGAEDPANASFGAYQGFHAVTGNYLLASSGRRVGVALMRFEHAIVCFRADLARVDTRWSVERWEPIPWAECQPELARLPGWVREEWRDVLP